MSRVEQARRAAGMTQNEAAAILGVSGPTYIKKEQEPSTRWEPRWTTCRGKS